MRKRYSKVLFLIYQGHDEGAFEKVQVWEILQNSSKVIEKVENVWLQTLKGEFKVLKMNETEFIIE